MRQLLYYPNFNIGDESWLKYALLYVEELRPIIPYSGLDQLRDETRLVFNETNLINPYNPSVRNAINASSHAVDVMNKIIRNKNRYTKYFGLNELFESQTNPTLRTNTLYSEKFNYEFYSFCIDNNFATKCTDGILISPQLSNIYMTILSTFIGEFENISTITDNTDIYNIHNLLKVDRTIQDNRYDPRNSRNLSRTDKLAITSINQNIPGNIDDISIADLIKLRNSKGYMEKLKAFNISLDEYIHMMSVNQFDLNLQEFLLHSKNELVSSIKTLSKEMIVFLLSIGFYMSDNNQLHLLGAALQGGAVVSATKKVFRNSDGNYNHKQSRKLLADISRLPL